MSEPSGTRIDLGPASAYAYAVANGYTGTEAEFGAYLAQASTKASETVINAAAAAVDALKAEGYAVGKQGGVDVDSQSGYFENNAKFFMELCLVATVHYPKVENGYWYIWDVQNEQWSSTGVKATGADGISPTVSVSSITGGHRITITDGSGDHTFNVINGTNGEDGDDGVSPIITVTDIIGGHRVTITDATGNHNFDVMDGTDGQDGTDGVGVPSGGTTGQVLKKKSGTDYDTEWGNEPSVPVQDVQINGVSILNNGVANIPQPKTETVSGSTPSITGVANTRYMCGEVSSISITPPQSGIIDVVFTSGTTPAVLTVPNTVKWPGWFDPSSLDASCSYELNIMDGVYGAVMAWA